MLIFALYYPYTVYSYNPESAVHAWTPFIGISFLILLFRKTGSLNIGGNFLAGAFFFTLLPATFSSGGIYSDNLIWMGAVPFIAFLFATRTSGIIWLVLLQAFTFYLYQLEVNSAVSYKSQIADYGADYYYFSWMLLFGVFTFIVYIFARGEFQITSALLDKEKQLTQRKNELTQQTKALRANEQKLKDLNNSLEHFAYAASHDLKEPIRMISMYTKMLEKKIGPQLDESSKEYMHFITDGTDRMFTLLEDLLQFSRANHSEGNLSTIDLNDIILIVKNNLAFSIKSKQATITIKDTLPKVLANTSLVTQLFQNLISNAIKFCPENRTPLVTISHKIKEDHFIIEIKDNGIGIAPENHAKIFEVFTRLHQRTAFEGSGIGLATCKKIIKSMGGDITLHSEEGRGTSFFITLPHFYNAATPEVAKTKANIYNLS